MAVAVPVTFALTLLVNSALGYTINRVTLFALILSLGLVVDDPIVDVENIDRHFQMRPRAAASPRSRTAVNEVRPPILLRDAGGDRLLPADVLHHRHDGPVHAADGAERAAWRC